MKQRKTVRLAGPFSVEALIETHPNNSSKVLGYNIRGPGSDPHWLYSEEGLRRNDARGALSQVGQLMILAWFDRRRIAVDEPRVGAVARLVDTTVHRFAFTLLSEN